MSSSSSEEKVDEPPPDRRSIRFSTMLDTGGGRKSASSVSYGVSMLNLDQSSMMDPLMLAETQAANLRGQLIDRLRVQPKRTLPDFPPMKCHEEAEMTDKLKHRAQKWTVESSKAPLHWKERDEPLPGLYGYQVKKLEAMLQAPPKKEVTEKKRKEEIRKEEEEVAAKKLKKTEPEMPKLSHWIEIMTQVRKKTVPSKEASAILPKKPTHLDYWKENWYKFVILPMLKRNMMTETSQKGSSQKYLNITDPLEMLRIVKEDIEVGFLYMAPLYPRTSLNFLPYAMRVVDYSEVDNENYWTMSVEGITQYVEGEATFSTLEQWEEDYRTYLKISQLKTFSRFQLWKPFATWVKTIRFLKLNQAREEIHRKLFYSSTFICPVLHKLATCFYELSKQKLFEIDTTSTLQVSDWLQLVLSKVYKTQEYISDIRQDCKEKMLGACLHILQEIRDSPQVSDVPQLTDGVKDNKKSMMKTAKLSKGGETDDFNPQSSLFFRQAIKRNACLLGSKFISMIDYLFITTLHTIAINNIDHFSEALKPPEDNPDLKLQDDDDEELDLEMSDIFGEKKASQKWQPLFFVTVKVQENQLVMEPPRELFEEAAVSVLKKTLEVCSSYENMCNDPYFNAIIRPVIHENQEGIKLTGRGPNALQIFSNDDRLQGKIKNILDTVNSDLNELQAYIKSFTPLLVAYLENEKTDYGKILESSVDPQVYDDMLSTFYLQKRKIVEIEDGKILRVFRVNNTELKHTMLPSINACIKIVIDRMPKLSFQLVKELIKNVNDSQSKLDYVPTNAREIMESLQFLIFIQNEMDSFEERLDTIRDFYELMDLFEIEVNPEEYATYTALSNNIRVLSYTIEKLLTEKETLEKRLRDNIAQEITLLREDIQELRENVEVPLLLDPTTLKVVVDNRLDSIQDTLTELKSRATDINKFQAYLQVEEPTQFADLDDISISLHLKKLMWNSQEEWSRLETQYYQDTILTLNSEVLGQKINTFSKIIQQVERGLPPNGVISILKAKVEIFKEKLPTLNNLTNPSFKPRHWEALEAKVNIKLMEPPANMKLLEASRIFEWAEAIQELSGQASSEAGLETMLNKIEEQWQHTEFIILSHRNQKDIYILGATDDIGALLDDSLVNISTIASSRYVGPFQDRVDQWKKQLDLFSKTLDEWLDCQRNWLYLESIFSAPDIQRQLPTEAKMFIEVDKSWKSIMKSVYMMPKALPAATKPGLLAVFQNNNGLLDQIMQCLEAYLESKRVIFPRFYFLSNDELLEILAQTRNPLAVQPHLRKCFDAIAKLEFASGEAFDILGMISPEGENVPLSRGLKARGNVEDWLGKVEESMYICLRRIAKTSLEEYSQFPRKEWLVLYPSQVVLTVSQIMWCLNVTEVLQTRSLSNLQEFETRCFEELNASAAMVRGELTKLNRAVLCALITIDVHARDIITDMLQHQVTSLESFEWLKQLRYYWDTTIDDCIVRMSNSEYIYGYEYLGASPRLVITPLTDKCYLCLMGALQLNLGGAPAGPAGTGKTETTKDLAKSLAKQCVVFNCSEGLDYKMMGKFFSGLAQSGAWCCFDEFNRIDIEVLSVIAQQLLTIRNAKVAKVKRFIFEGREIRLVPSCAAFITMNPGYAGRTELPDNLKALFRPVSMMVPDYTLIAEVILYSEGFESSKTLAHKMTQMYKLCSEQLSQQDHYDFGMRALKSVLVMAGSLKRENPDKPEDIVILRALHDSNMPKFLAKDGVLFKAILQDLFPGAVLPVTEYGIFNTAILHIIQEKGLQPEETFIKKIIQFFETMVVRHGVMLVGPAGSGKTTCYEVLGAALTYLHANKHPSPYYQPVHTYVLNPKSITMGELYGEVNLLTLEWKDGLLGYIVRGAVQDESEDHHWVVCDGPVDAVWIENLNTVLDDNKMLCLANSERIKYTPYIHMVFEVQDLAQASPATVSRCGMVYIDAEDLSWRPVVKTWIQNLPQEVPEHIRILLYELYDFAVDGALHFTRKNCLEIIPQVNMAKVCTLSNLMESLFHQPYYLDIKDSSTLENVVAITFLFCYWWAFSGTLTESTMELFDGFLIKHFDDYPRVKLPSFGAIRDYFPDFRHKKLELWQKLVPAYTYDLNVNFFDILVPTLDTVRYSFLMQTLLKISKPILYTGSTGVGKSVIAQDLLKRISQAENYVPVFMNFSAQTNSRRTQEIIEIKLDKKRKNLYGAPVGKKIVIFIDDLNMPQPEIYGAQPPIELLRQYLDFHGFYDRETLQWKQIENVILSAACGPPGGGRNNVTPRILRHFSIFNIPQPTGEILKQIFLSITRGFFANFAEEIFKMCEGMVKASVEIYARMLAEFLPTPTKSHYIFNLRDLSKSIQGLMQGDPDTIKNGQSMFNLFLHESMRVFHDRLIDNEDRLKFVKLLSEVASMNFSYATDAASLIEKPILFGDFLKFMADPSERHYEEMKDHNKVKNILIDYIDDYNFSTPKEIKLVFFMDAIQHVTRIARIIRQERGNALLVGVGGCGKQSLTKLASHLCMYTCFQIELTKGYGYSEFHDDLKKLYEATGSNNENKVFLFTDNQVVKEEFLEDINNILNSGEVPSLFEPEEFEKVLMNVRLAAKAAGVGETRDALYNFFVSRVRQNLHIVLAMSPVGSAFRVRCRMFPSLVNCCSIDWFNEWPNEALQSVAENSFAKLTLEDPTLIPRLSQMCMAIHARVNKIALRFQQELNRPYYTTPTSYLELINLYLSFLGVKHKQIALNKKKFFNGVSKLIDTNKLVAGMEVELKALAPKLKQKSADTEALMQQLTIDQAEADKVREIVKKEETMAQATADATAAIKADAQKDLDEALPALEKSVKALNSLDKNDISEVRVFNKPPEMVQVVMEAVCILLGSKTDWASAKALLGETNFLKQLEEYDKDHISESIQKKLRKYMENPKFQPDIVAKTSKACKSLCMWVRAMDLYAKVFKTVEPKRKRLAEAEAVLAKVMEELKLKQESLAQVQAQIKKLESKYAQSVAESDQLKKTMAQTASRLQRASKLTQGLADEQIRWKELVELYELQLGNVVGDCLVAAACVAYYGAFTSIYRQQLVEEWMEACEETAIPVSENFQLVSILADNYEIQNWEAVGLPKDNVSRENAVLVTRGRRWPLMIDPQDQANHWIKTMEAHSRLKVVRQSDSNFQQVLEMAIRVGMPVLLEDIGETIDPSLEPILLKQFFMQGGRLMIHFGDSDIEYDRNFRLYITTKLANPHYLPEVCIKVTIINFTVTPSGLEDQLLSEVVRLERPDLEEQRQVLIRGIANDKAQLKALEDKILDNLFHSKGNILDDEELVKTLKESKITSSMVTKRLRDAQITEEKISVARERYRPVATRGSNMYFVVANMALVDPMYQYSLSYFTKLFSQTITTSPKSTDLGEHLLTLINNITVNVYTNISRGLFAKDKQVFSFILAVSILMQKGTISQLEWLVFLRGTSSLRQRVEPLPADAPTWLSPHIWQAVCDLDEGMPCFSGLPHMYLGSPLVISLGEDRFPLNDIVDSEDKSSESEEEESFDESLTDFQKLLLIKILREEKVVIAVTDFIQVNLGKTFIEEPAVDMYTLYETMSNKVPLVFILSAGSDPMSNFIKFAGEMGFMKRFQAISLGQGQGPVAEKIISSAKRNGNWVFLQNCHLATSWMLTLENIVQSLGSHMDLHSDFRMFLSSMPARTFPVAVLQNSVKVTNEPPKGIRSNVQRAFANIEKEFFEYHVLKNDWRKMVFGLCFFHSIILERKKFGSLGWNIKYEFNDSDRECALLNLQMFCKDIGMNRAVAEMSQLIPWEALVYLTGEITYGGRVTDFWDQRCLRTILRVFFTPKTLVPGYTYSPNGIYYAPEYQTLEEYREYVDNLPIIDDPEIFGMHQNANITFQISETSRLVNTILEIQPKMTAAAGAKTDDETVYEKSEEIQEQIIQKLDSDTLNPELLKRDRLNNVNSLTTVLLQEVDRFNRLVNVIHVSLRNLKKAIKGIVVMSEDLEGVYLAFLKNQVPRMWAKSGYLSIKSLGSWVKDLVLRIHFVTMWLIRGFPKSYWLPGFFFQQGFLTGVLQNYARKYACPIDQLSFKFTVIRIVTGQEEIAEAEFSKVPGPLDSMAYPLDGVYVHGLFLDAASYNVEKGVLQDPLPGVMNSPLPVLLMEPKISYRPPPELYVCPLYKTSDRAGTLSTTGHSTNFVVAVFLPTVRPTDYWINMGTAMLCQVTD